MSVEILRPKNLTQESVSAGFFTRKGGLSKGVYESLNCGPGSSDDPKAVSQNRSLAMEALSEKRPTLCTLYQIHSNQVLTVTEPFNDRPKADALVTKTPGLALGILTADCAPVLLADKAAGTIAAAHAGWRGALAGILEETIKVMQKLGTEPKKISAAIGPCIAQASYEVGVEFRDAFLARDENCARYFGHGLEGRFQFALEDFVEDKLRACGVEKIEKLSLDTYVLEDRFFSYRRSVHRNEPDYGRQLSTICLLP